MAKKPKPAPTRTPVAEWIAAALGAVVTLTAIGFIAAEAAQPSAPAALTAEVVRTRTVPGGSVLEVEVSNAGDETAAGVHIEAGAGIQTSQAVIDYVPGHGRRTVSLAFSAPAPATAPQVRVVGWTEP